MAKNARAGAKLVEEAERLYFILAIGVVLFAGDLVWWQAQQTNDYLIEQEAASIYGVVSDPDKRLLIELDKELEEAQLELDALTEEETQ